MPRVVFDTLAETQFIEHFQVEAGALFDALRLHQFAVRLEELDALAQFDLDRLDCLERGASRRHVMAGGIDGIARHLLVQVSGQRIEQGQRLHLVVEQRDAQRRFRAFRGEYVEHVAAHAEGPAPEVEFVALVLHLGQSADDIALALVLFLPEMQDHAVVVHRVADAVDRRHRGDDHCVVAFEQRFGSG